MDLQAMTMPVDEARNLYHEYRRAVRERKRAEDVALMRGYRALARGQRVIDLNVVMRVGGRGADGLPRLAITGAHRQWVHLRHSGNAWWFIEERGHWQDGRVKRGKVAVSDAHLSGPPAGFYAAQAMVPLIPPWLRPAEEHLSKYHVLWEAQWKAVPPVDPALLRWISGSLYAVIAVWDLTPLEQAVLGAARAGGA